jgi:copper chaperone
MNRSARAIIKLLMPDRKPTEFTLKIDGMHCGSCVRRVSQAIAAVPGVQVNEVRVGRARFTSLQHPSTIEKVIDTLVQAGFAAHLES